MDADFLIVGGGIAGLSCAAFLSPLADVTLIERETQLSHHATGRSAALYTESSELDQMVRLIRASRSYLVESPDALTRPRGAIFVAEVGDAERLDQLDREFANDTGAFVRISPEEVAAYIPALPAPRLAGALLETGAVDIDVHALVTAYRQTTRTHGGTILTGAPLTALSRKADGWLAVAGERELRVRVVVNAAGAWGDEIAVLAGVAPLSLSTLERSVFTFVSEMNARRWPFVFDARDRWYLKPEGDDLLGSAMNETPVTPYDARPREVDVAKGIDAINDATELHVRSVKSQWAGIRTFAADRLPAVGFEPGDAGFFWVVGQGGNGIMTSPAMGALAAALLTRTDLPAPLVGAGVEPAALAPARFR